MTRPDDVADRTAASRSRESHQLTDSNSFSSAIDERFALLENLWREQAICWQRGDRHSIEHYLERVPLDARDSLICDLIYGEWVLRRRLGEEFDLDDYLQRFSKFEHDLRRQWEFDSIALAVEQSTQFDAIATGHASSCVDEVSELPDRIGRYVVLGRLGLGGQAEVYRAHDPTLHRDVVIKLSHEVVTPDSTERWLNEGRALAKLTHANLASVFDCGVHHGRAYMVMEFVDGQSLQQFATLSQMSTIAAASMIAKIADALAAAHRHGITHCDVKPQNIVIQSSSGEPKLIDFGFAQHLNVWRATEPNGGIIGSVQYMAPEQANGRTDQLSPRTDVYALGGVFYFLLTGHPPRSDTSFPELLARAQHGDWDRDRLTESFSGRRIAKVIATAIATNPAERYASAAEFGSAVRGLRRRTFLGRLAVVVVFVVFGVMTAMAVRPHPPAPLPEKPCIVVRVWRDGRFIDLVDAMPLASGDEFRIETDVPTANYAALAACSSGGEWTMLAELSSETTNRRLMHPPLAGQALKLQPPGGTQVLWLGWRRDRSISLEDLLASWTSSSEMPVLPSATVLRMLPNEVVVEQRGRDLGPVVDRPDPQTSVEQVLDNFRQRLSRDFDYAEAVAFSHD